MIACHALIDSEINNNPLEKTKENKKKDYTQIIIK